MKRKDVQLLIGLLGILLAVVSWQFIYNPNIEEAETITAENDTLKVTIKELEDLNANRETYISETESMKQTSFEIIDRFPAAFLMEDEIMYLYNMENVTHNQIVVPNISFGTQNEVPYSGTLTVGEYQLQDDGIKLVTAQDNITFSTTYTGLKNVIKHIYGIPGRKSISNVGLTAGADGYLSGNMTVDFYALFGTEKLYSPLDIKGVQLGKSNIFGVLDTNVGEDADEDDETEEDEDEESEESEDEDEEE